MSTGIRKKNVTQTARMKKVKIKVALSIEEIRGLKETQV